MLITFQNVNVTRKHYECELRSRPTRIVKTPVYIEAEIRRVRRVTYIQIKYIKLISNVCVFIQQQNCFLKFAITLAILGVDENQTLHHTHTLQDNC